MTRSTIIADLRHDRRTAHQDDGIQILEGDLGLFDDQFDGRARAFQEVGGKLIQQLPRDGDVHVLAVVAAGNLDFRLLGQLHLRQVAVVMEDLNRLLRLAKIFAELFLELIGHIFQHPIVPVDAAQFDVPVRGQDPEVGRSVLDHGHVEGAAAEIVDHHAVRLFRDGLFNPAQVAHLPGVRERGGGRLVDDIDHVETGDAAGVFRRLAALVVEIIRDGDYRVRDRADPPLCILAEFLEDQRGEELGADGVAVELPFIIGCAHVPLDPLNDPFGILHRRSAPVGTDDDVPARGQEHHARGFNVIVLVGKRGRSPILIQHGDGGESRAQIDPDCLAWFKVHDLGFRRSDGWSIAA